MTTLNRIGVIRGTTISRGVRALSASRRRASVANGVSNERLGRGSATSIGVGGAVVMAVMRTLLESGGEAIAGQSQVHVVERWAAGAHPFGGDTELGNGGHGVTGCTPVERNGQG